MKTPRSLTEIPQKARDYIHLLDRLPGNEFTALHKDIADSSADWHEYTKDDPPVTIDSIYQDAFNNSPDTEKIFCMKYQLELTEVANNVSNITVNNPGDVAIKKERLFKINQVQDYVTNRLEQITASPAQRIKNNDYPRVFVNDIAYSMFDYIHNRYKIDLDHALANYSFLYWQMWNNKLIYSDIKPGDFRVWLNDTFKEIPLLEKLKTELGSYDKKKINHYTAVNDIFKPSLK